MVQIFNCWGLSLDVTDNMLFPVPDPEIRISGLGLFGERGDVDLFLASGLYSFSTLPYPRMM